jgi:hypothetical protein
MVVGDNEPVIGEPVVRGRGRPRLTQLRLTAAQTVAITPDQQRQAVDLPASMILNYHARTCGAGQREERPPTTA